LIMLATCPVLDGKRDESGVAAYPATRIGGR